MSDHNTRGRGGAMLPAAKLWMCTSGKGQGYGLELERQIFSKPPRTSKGLSAKAAIAASHVTIWTSGEVSESDLPLWSLCRDLMGNDPGDGTAASDGGWA
jgi:hypothetical protein